MNRSPILLNMCPRAHTRVLFHIKSTVVWTQHARVCVSDDVYNVNTSTVFCLLQWSSANSPKLCVCARRHVSKCKISMCVCVSVCELMYQTGTYSCFPIIKPVWTWIYYESNKKQTTWGSHLASRWGKTGFQCCDPTGNQVLKEGGSAQV